MNTSEGHLISNDLERCFAMRKGEKQKTREEINVCSKEGYAESGYAKKDTRNRLRWRLMICFYEP